MSSAFVFTVNFLTILLHFPQTSHAQSSATVNLSSSYEENLVRRGALPPSSYDPFQNLQRPTRLEDFMWTGSGDGPNAADQDGGLAWEDNLPPTEDGSGAVRVTKTMTLYKTVMTTIYPVEMTPTVVLVPMSPTPRLSSVSSFSFDSSRMFYYSSELPDKESSINLQPSSSSQYNLQTEIVELTTGEPNNQKTTVKDELEPEPVPTPAPESQPEVPASTELVYQVKTVIKATKSEIDPYANFQKKMQKGLARVYASAFKRHLLTSLGVLNTTQLSENQNNLRRRRQIYYNKRSTELEPSKETVDFERMFLGQHVTTTRLKQLATTSMNVSVAIIEITPVTSKPHMEMKYIVCAEGSPIPGSSAVQDLQLISKTEMEKEIGYEVINKAEALIGGSQSVSHISTSETSPWLIVAITTICLMVVLILVIMYMVWKWKHNRLGDTSPRPRPQSGIEEGVVNPVFLGPASPIEREHEARRHERSPKGTRQSIYSNRKKFDTEDDSILTNASTRYRTDSRRQQQEALAIELSSRLAEEEYNVSPPSVKSADKSSTEKQESSGDSAQLLKSPASPRQSSTKAPRARQRKSVLTQPKSASPSSGKRKGANEQQRRRRRRTGIVGRPKEDEGNDDEYRGESGELSEERVRVKYDDRTFPDKFEISPLDTHLQESGSKSMDKISYEHLDVCEDTIAKTPSDHAKKLIAEGKSSSAGPSVLSVYNFHEQRERRKKKRKGMRFPETIDEISDDGLDNSYEEQDRELSEKSFEPSESALTEPSMKDAQVQTPTKLSLRPKPKPRARRARTGKKSSDSLISTESEEIIEIHHIDSTSSESNPLGRMRKRFHQFLDDAFNVMVSGKKEDDVEDGRAKSAKVSISHHVETRQDARPWTSHVIREESIHRLRPKSATAIGPPRRAWTAGSERRCHSAKSDTHDKPSDSMFEGESNVNFEPDECDATSTIFSERGVGERHGGSSAGNTSSIVSPVPIFPRYPIYPDIPVETAESTNRIIASGSRQPITDPAVPLIQAIKDEIQRFEKCKITEPQGRSSSSGTS